MRDNILNEEDEQKITGGTITIVEEEEVCPQCGSKNIKTTYKVDRNGRITKAVFRHTCNDCGYFWR